MNRIISASTAAIVGAMVLSASPATACISCSYVPEVVKGSRTSDGPASRGRRAERPSTRRPNVAANRDQARKRIVKQEPAVRRPHVATVAPVRRRPAPAAVAAVPIEVAKPAPVAVATPTPLETAAKPAAVGAAGAVGEAPAQSLAVAATAQTPTTVLEGASIEVVPPAPNADNSGGGCKRVIALADTTVSVPCE